MIEIVSDNGEILKTLPFENGKVIGYNRQFGFVSREAMNARQRRRERHGFSVGKSPAFDFNFSISGSNAEDWFLENGENCQLVREGGGWQLTTAQKKYQIRSLGEIKQLPVDLTPTPKDRNIWVALAVSLLVPLIFLVLPKRQSAPEAPVIIEQVMVKIKPEVQRHVEVSSAMDHLPEVKKQSETTKRAIVQNLGFLGLLGRKDLKKAIGGVPTQMKDVSAGAGPGGKEGSGGELLVGLGQGLQRTTVGNTGVAGLGGVGTRGAGGGAGGYGNSAIGSGEGKALSTVPLSQDIVLEGGLDRSVVQATIAKYLSQVRACYERGLQRNPGLGGRVTMNFEIGGAGDMNFANVESTSLDNKDVEDCISQRMLGWKFPRPRGGVNVKVSYPFVLRSTHS